MVRTDARDLWPDDAIVDPRATHYWDEAKAVGSALASRDDLGAWRPVAWDVWAVFPQAYDGTMGRRGPPPPAARSSGPASSSRGRRQAAAPDRRVISGSVVATVMIKVELHTHTSADPVDRILHDAGQLIDRASSLGYGALAVTLHDRWHDPAPWHDRAVATRRHADSRHRAHDRGCARPAHQRAARGGERHARSTISAPSRPPPTRSSSRRIRSIPSRARWGRGSNSTAICSTRWRSTRCMRAASISIAGPSNGPPRTASRSSATRTSTCWHNWGRRTRWWMPRPPSLTRFVRPYGWDEYR